MAVRKTSARRTTRTRRKTPSRRAKGNSLRFVVLFWVLFFLVVGILFWINGETISNNWKTLTQRSRVVDETIPDLPETPPQTSTKPDRETTSGGRASGNQSTTQTDKPTTTTPTTPSANTEQKPPETKPVDPKPAVTREQSIYFTQVDKDGAILRYKVSRNIAASDSPLHDSLSALLAGPSADEQRRGLMTLIPSATRILSATIRGNTAYISFSEDFMYNTYGVEGYAAQLRQIIWTATEFSTVNDVQFLIEGRRVDYLGEGIWIGSPLSRESL